MPLSYGKIDLKIEVGHINILPTQKCKWKNGSAKVFAYKDFPLAFLGG